MTIGKIFVAAIIICLACVKKSEPNWTSIKLQLESIEKDDQRYRLSIDSMGKLYSWQSPEMQTLWRKQGKLDSADLVQIELILKAYGFPPTSKVGTANEAVFYTLQHSPDSIMEKYYDVIKKAGEDGELKKKEVALYIDRVLMNRGEPQLYGSQIRIEFKTNPKTGERYDSIFLWRLKDPQNIEKMRSEMGLKPLNEYLKHFEIDPAKGYLIRKNESKN